LREEIEDLRAKWDDEVLNSSTWAKEKARLEVSLQDLSNSRDGAVSAHNEAQSKIVSLLSQIRNLRTSFDDTAAERDHLVKEKRGIETRLREASEKLEELSRGDNPNLRNAAGMDRELLELKSSLAEREDVAIAAVDKMRRAEALAQEIQKDIVTERESNIKLHKEKAAIDKLVKDLQLKLVDLETKSYSTASQDVRFLHGRIQELETQIEAQESAQSKSARSVRNVDRTVRDLQSQLERKEKSNHQLEEDVSKSKDKVERLLQTIEELQSSDGQNQLAARRAERELRVEKEKCLKLERELEGWKALRVNRSGTTLSALSEDFEDSVDRRRSVNFAREGSLARSVRGSSVGIETPQRKASDSKGFL
jgi:myosin heavy chain 9/10/11/14